MATIDTSEEVRVSAPKSPPRENLVRATPGIELRDSHNAMPTLAGHFAVWDQWTEIRSAYEGNFMERFTASSMAKTLSESTPKVLFQHGKDPQVGDKPLGTVRSLAPDDQGAFYEVEMLDTSYNRDLVPGLQAGLYGASFRFSVVRENVVQRPSKSDWNPRGIPERTVEEARVMEFGPVTFPAYAGATAGIRSMTDEYLFDTLAAQPHHLGEIARRSGISLAGLKRFDNEDVGCLAQMIQLGSCYIGDQDEAHDAADIAAMQAVVKSLTGLMQGEFTEVEPAEPDDEMNSANPDGDERDAVLEPDASERTTPTEPGTEPEPSEATTHSDRGLFWFTDPPAHLKRSK